MNIKEFSRDPISLLSFWLTTGPVLAAILLLTLVIVIWKRPFAEALRADIRRKLGLTLRKEIYYARERGTKMTGPELYTEKKYPWSRKGKTSDVEAPNLEESASPRPYSYKWFLPRALVRSPPPHRGGSLPQLFSQVSLPQQSSPQASLFQSFPQAPPHSGGWGGR